LNHKFRVVEHRVKQEAQIGYLPSIVAEERAHYHFQVMLMMQRVSIREFGELETLNAGETVYGYVDLAVCHAWTFY
jgi:hypothetical protein